MAIDRIYKMPKTARLFDHVIQSVQDALGDIAWLDHVFGRCERLVKVIEGRRIYTPNVYRGREDYISLLPDNRVLGNYCFFVMGEPQEVSRPTQVHHLRAPFSLVVWVDMRTIPNEDDRNTEVVKLDVLRVFRQGWIRQGYMTVGRIWERAENVFDGFTLDEVDNQFLMAPYAGFRFTGEMWINEDCEV